MNVEDMYEEVDVRVCEHGLYVWAPNSVGKLYAPTYNVLSPLLLLS